MTPCPSDDVLGAHVKRALPEHDTEVVSSHLDECASCRQIVLAAVRGGMVSLAIGTPTDLPIEPTLPMARTRGALATGQHVGRYEIRGLLGAGGMGQVYRAYDSELDRELALKVMRPELAGSTNVLAERLVRESRMMAKLAHPSVISVYDVGRTGNSVFIAMELIRGETLGSYVARAKPSWRELLALLERAGHGLAAAHDAGIIHRDFKPENVLVESESTRVVVTDFGIARTADELDRAPASDEQPVNQPTLTKTGTTVGTPAYMAPEQLAGRTVDSRADQFAFAVSAWELLFGVRPFNGNALDEIRAAMATVPEPPRGHSVPARVVAELRRGLALRPENRHRDMRTFVRVLAATHARSKRVVVALGTIAAIGLVGSGIVAARLGTASDTVADPCARSLATFEASYTEPQRHALRAALGDNAYASKAFARLDRTSEQWREVHGATCSAGAEPPQALPVAACLEARRVELAGVVVDVLLDGQATPIAGRLVDVIVDPSSCATPAPGLISARVPVDPALRRKVSALRYRAFAAEEMRERGDYKSALVSAAAIAAEAKPLWPPLHAESLYLLGATEAIAGDSAKGIATLREAANLAERVNHHYIAANAWIQLMHAAAFDAGDLERGLEYATLAEAALERIGHKANVTVMFHYTKGAALANASRTDEAELELRKALELAERKAPELVALVIQGLGFALEARGKYGEAVTMYRRALVELAKQTPHNLVQEITFRDRLASNLNTLGQNIEAEREARASVALADKLLADNNLDRAVSHANLAQILQSTGKADEALAEANHALVQVARVSGERSARYGEVLQLVGMILNDLERFDEANTKFARACEIVAFEIGDQSHKLAECWMHQAIALSGLAKNADAIVLIEKVLPVFAKLFGEDHPQVATALVTRGGLYVELGMHAKAVPDFERAIASFTKHARELDIGHLGGAKWGFAQALYPTDPIRARAVAAEAITHLEGAAAAWHPSARDAKAWLAQHK